MAFDVPLPFFSVPGAISFTLALFRLRMALEIALLADFVFGFRFLGMTLPPATSLSRAIGSIRFESMLALVCLTPCFCSRGRRFGLFAHGENIRMNHQARKP